MRILCLSQWFDPEPFFKGLFFMRELVRRGHEVQVLTGFPNYPGGKLYDGYKIRLLQREEVEGISVLRVPLYPSHDRSGVRRFANYASFAASAATLGPLVVKPADVAYVYHPPGTVGWPAMVIKALRQIPFVYDIQDLWPDTVTATGMLHNPLAYRLLDGWLRLTYRQAGHLTVLSPGFKEALVSRGVPAEKITVIYNWCDESSIGATPKDEALAAELGLAGRFNVMFAGTMGKAQGLETVLGAAHLLQEQRPEVQFCLVGGGIEVEALKQQAETMQLRNVRFLPRRPPAEIGQVLNLADALLVHLTDDPLFSITIPSKTQAYMAVGKPILMAVRGDSAALVERAGAGVVCEPENPAALAAAVLRLVAQPPEKLRAMGERGRQFYHDELSLAKGVSKFEAVFSEVVGKHQLARKRGE